MPLNPKGSGRSIKPRLKKAPKYPKGGGRSVKPKISRRSVRRKSKIRRNRNRKIKGR